MAAAGLSALRRGQVPGVPKRPIVHGNSAEIVFPNTFCATEIFIEKIILKKIEKNDFFSKDVCATTKVLHFIFFLSDCYEI